MGHARPSSSPIHVCLSSRALIKPQVDLQSLFAGCLGKCLRLSDSVASGLDIYSTMAELNEKPPVGETPRTDRTSLDRQGDAEKIEGPSSDDSPSESGMFKQTEPGQDVEGTGAARHSSLASAPSNTPKFTDDGKRIITEEECSHLIGYGWPSWKKWMLLTAIFIVQVQMNFNTSVYPNAIGPVSEHFGVTEMTARLGQALYLIFYAFGCELWAPWSEEFGRWKILQ